MCVCVCVKGSLAVPATDVEARDEVVILLPSQGDSLWTDRLRLSGM